MATKRKTSTSTSKYIDSRQHSDPTFNVSELVDAATRRLDDLADLKNENTKEVINLNKEILNLHIYYAKELNVAESKRIDAIRAVDVQAAALYEERTRNQASILANQVKQAEDNSRNLVTLTADTLRTQVITPLIDRISTIERAQYENKGSGAGKEQGGKNIMDIIKIVILIVGFLYGIFTLQKQFEKLNTQEPQTQTTK